MLTIKLKPNKSLQRKLKKIANPSKAIARGLKDYETDIKKEVVEYAPESEANRPPGPSGYSWYKRRFGTVTTTGKKYKTSQDMLNKWRFVPKSTARGAKLTIFNLATYSPYVVGRKQVGFHARRGWKKTWDIIERTKDDALDRIEEQIDKELRR